MKLSLPLTLVFLFLFSCKDPVIIEPEPSMSPPVWLIGNWLHSDSTTAVVEKMIVSDDDIVLERFPSTGKTSMSVIDSCKTNNITLSDYIKYNSYYSLEFTKENEDSVHIIYYAKISDAEIRIINEVSPTPKTYTRQEN